MLIYANQFPQVWYDIMWGILYLYINFIALHITKIFVIETEDNALAPPPMSSAMGQEQKQYS